MGLIYSEQTGLILRRLLLPQSVVVVAREGVTGCQAAAAEVHQTSPVIIQVAAGRRDKETREEIIQEQGSRLNDAERVAVDLARSVAQGAERHRATVELD